MPKNYFFLLFLTLTFMIYHQGFSQNGFNEGLTVKKNIQDLSIFPNPVNDGKTFIYITSKLNLSKKVEFFNVIGKQVSSIMLTGKELNISNLSKGVYILRITENDITETRKLVIK